MAAPPRVAALAARARPTARSPVLHACADAVHLEVAGRCVGLVGPHGPGTARTRCGPIVLVRVVIRAATAYVEGGILHWGGRALVAGRLVDVRAPRIDAARVPKASPAADQGTPRSRGAGLVAFRGTASYSTRHRRRPGRPRRRPDPARRRRPVRLARRPPRRRRRRRPPSTTPYAGAAAHHDPVRDAPRVRPRRRGRRPRRGLPARPRHAAERRRAGRAGGARPQLRARASPTASTSPSRALTAEQARHDLSTDHVELRAGAYADSVTLLQVSRQVAAAARRRDRPGRDGDAAQRRGARADGLRDPRRRHRQPPGRRGPARRRRRARRRPRRGRPGPDRAPPPGRRCRPRRRRRAPRRRRCAASRGRWCWSRCPGASAAVEAMDALEAGTRRDGLQRQRPGRAGGRAQAVRRRPRPARDGARLRDRGRRRARARVRQRRRARSGRDRRRVRHRLPAGARPARPRRRRRHHGVRRGRARPVRRGRRPRDPHGPAPGSTPTPASSWPCWSPSPRPTRSPPSSRRTPTSLGTPVQLALLGRRPPRPHRRDRGRAAARSAARCRPGRCAGRRRARPRHAAARAVRRRHA